MNATGPNHRRYSADIRMALYVNGRVFTVGQLGPDFVILDDPTDHPPADGEISVTIDVTEKRWPVQLPDGVSASSPETRIIRSRSTIDPSAGG